MYKETIYITKTQSETIKEYLKKCILSEDESVVYTARFPDGKEMDIKCCGSQDEPAWTEAVLFNERGVELRFTEPEHEYLGEWVVGDYVVEVKERG